MYIEESPLTALMEGSCGNYLVRTGWYRRATELCMEKDRDYNPDCCCEVGGGRSTCSRKYGLRESMMPYAVISLSVTLL